MPSDRIFHMDWNISRTSGEPLSIPLKFGEQIFVVGANGSGKSALLQILLRCKRTSCVLDGLPLTDSYGSTREILPSLRITAESLTRTYGVMTSNRTLDGRITILAKGRRLSYSTWLPTRTIEPDPSRITSIIEVLKKPLEFLQNRRLLSHRSTNCLRSGR